MKAVETIEMGEIFGRVLKLSRCPHCYVKTPNIDIINSFLTADAKDHEIYWSIGCCSTCGGAILLRTDKLRGHYFESYPETQNSLSNSIPQRASEYLTQAIESKTSPAGSIMLSACAVDAMLKAKGYNGGSLYERIDKAASDHLITNEMRKWAHQIRLDANEQRHDDENQPLPSIQDADKCLNFCLALAEFLFVLPSKVTKGLSEVD